MNNRFFALSVLDRLRVLEGQLAESKAKTRLMESRLEDPFLSDAEAENISSRLAIVETDMILCLNEIMRIESEVCQILC